MVKEQKTTLPVFTATTIVGILIVGLLAVLAVNVIPLQQATALVGSSSGPNPQGQGSSPQGQGSSLQGNPIGSSPQGEQQGSEIQKQPPGVGGGCPPGSNAFNASQGRCFHP